MRLLRLSAAAVNQTPLDWDGNEANIRSAIALARTQGASLLCLPELCVSGYGCEDAFHSPAVCQRAAESLLALLPDTEGMVVSFGLPAMVGGAVFNMAALAVDGRLVGMVGKQNLAGDGVHYEPRWFAPWLDDVRSEADVAGQRVPAGDYIFDVGGVRIGFEICEDAWVGRRPGADLARHGVDVILNPSASHFSFGKQSIRRRFVLEGSRAFGVAYVYANLLGNEAGRCIYDGGTIIASAGAVLAEGDRFSYQLAKVTAAEADIDLCRVHRARTISARVDLSADPAAVIKTPFDWPVHLPSRIQAPQSLQAWNLRGPDQAPQRLAKSDWEHGPALKEEEFSRAVSLGLFDYMRKSRSNGFVISLSGGADSSATAALCGLALKMAAAELGEEGLRERLSYVPDMRESPGLAEITRRLVTTVYQATRNSGEVTLNAARAVAAELGAAFHYFDVDGVVEGYKEIVAQALGRPLSWQGDDIALQNIQARARAPGVWMLANVLGSLLLSTSNRSEAAVGYATMDGDTSGGLCPIAGIDKAFLRGWLTWMETLGPAGFGPLPGLKFVNEQQPTAELRPREAMQTDEDDLMPYDILDAIERAAIRDKQPPQDCLDLIAAAFPQHDRDQLLTWVRRFFTLFSRNQWKRERYAPSFHLDDENLDPKTWCRFPILSGGFARELRELK